ncbi:hypothetical protein [Zunongwangia sp.]|uniref:hypothetical protein n=1 Tax=Zunongwangia sp. TaxID=1965325 RepID=UPI003AA912FD
MEITKKEVEKLIELEEENTFSKHLKNVINRDFRKKGKISSNEIKFWKQDFWSKTIYPVFTFEFNNDNHLINISDKINPIGKILNIIIFLSYSILFLIPIINDFEILKNWRFISIFVVILALSIILIKSVYKFEKQNQLEYIVEFLDLEILNEKSKKEWTLIKMLTRVLIYPICIGLIILAISTLFPDGEIKLGLVSITIAGAYLFTDLTILLRKKTTGNNVYKK